MILILCLIKTKGLRFVEKLCNIILYGIMDHKQFYYLNLNFLIIYAC